MDILDRLLGHDAWTTRELLLRARDLTDEQLDRHFDIGHGTLRRTFVHLIGNIEVWTDLLGGRPPRRPPVGIAPGASVADLLDHLDRAAPDFAALARHLADEGRLDELWTDHLDDPPTHKTYGGAIAHLITHSLHHRAELLHILARLGVPDLPEGDVLSWEQTVAGRGADD